MIDNVIEEKQIDAQVFPLETAAPSTAYKNLRWQFFAVVFVQLILIAGFAAPKAYTLTTGRVITVKTMPVDPYDLFRGEYANLGYQGISQFETKLKLEHGQKVYVLLGRDKQSHEWTAQAIATNPIPAGHGQMVLKGEVSNYPYQHGRRQGVNVTYGVERLYMPEGQSLNLQRRAKDLTVELAVGADGEAVIKRVFDHGKSIYDGTNMFNPFKG